MACEGGMIRVDWLALLVASLFGLLLVTLVARLITWRLSRVPISLLNNSRPARYMLLGRSARTMSNLESDAWRNQKTGFSLQESTLISKLSIAGSIKLPLLCAGTPDKGHSRRFGQVLESLGIGSTPGRNHLNAPVRESRSSLRWPSS